MGSADTVSIKDSIATHLLKVVFSFYFLLTLTVTLGHMVAEYFNTKQRIATELEVIHRIFEPALSRAIWDMNQEQIQQTFVGVVQFPSVIGILLEDDRGKRVAAAGTIQNAQGKILLVEANGQDTPHEVAGLFALKFPIQYTHKGQTMTLGSATFYSSSGVVLKSIQLGFVLIVINAVIKTLALWTIFLWFGRKLLSKPLRVLTDATEQLRWDRLESFKVQVQTHGRNELKVLESAFNEMVQKLLHTREQLNASHHRLERLFTATRHLASERDRFHTMQEAAQAIIQELPHAQRLEFGFLETLSDETQGYAHFEIQANSESPSEASLNFESLGTFQHQFLSAPPAAVQTEFDRQQFRLCFWAESSLTLLVERANKLHGYLRLEGFPAAQLATPQKEFSETLAQSLALALENLENHLHLERQVIQRTKDLQIALRQLEIQNRQLRETQTQLVQAEKMASLGTLVAGVAHEINNPNNFVSLAAYNLQQSLRDLHQFILDLAGDDADSSFRQIFQERFEALYRSLSSVEEGSARIKAIVQDLRTFSRIEEAERKTFSVLEGLRSTVRLISTRYNQIVEVIEEFQADPLLDCWPAQLNQVFMNILVNACQAIQAKRTQSGPFSGKIFLRTWIKAGEVAIQFEDNGCGMSEETQKRIFEPFFTTKTVGEGTGLGMSISYNIVEKHQGRLEVASQVGEGTTLTLWLPLTLL